MKTTIILDTNFLLLPGQFHFDIFEAIEEEMQSSYQLAMVDKTFDELDRIIHSPSKKQKDKTAAKIAKELIHQKGLAVLPTKNEQNVDDALIEYGKQGYVIATQDKILIKKLQKAKAAVFQMRQKKHLMKK